MTAGATRAPRLRPGDTVALVAPSSGAPAELLPAGVRTLESWGLKVRVAPNVTVRPEGTFGFLADGDAVRAREFERAWLDPEVKALICSRGGDGANRMVERVDWGALRAAGPKILVGFSDITTLHVACARRLGLATLHGPMPLTSYFAEDAASREHLRRSLFEPESVRVLGTPGAEALVAGRARGVLVGGCLSVFAAELGTRYGLPDPAGAILCLEDTGENVTHLDRFLGQLERAGYLGAVAGVVLGSWTDCGEAGQVRELFAERLGGLGVPVLFGFGFGHGLSNMTLPLGVEAELDSASGTVEVLRVALG